MKLENSPTQIRFGAPARYRIVVQGHLGPEWSESLGGMSVTESAPDCQPPRTTLIGRLEDQAELNGVLETLFGFHLPILQLEVVEEEEG